MNKKAYTGIDYFRIIAAFLVVAIHTSPLSTYSGTADFILTRVFGRTAVPFFFMVSGFFLLSENNLSSRKLKTYVKKNALIYGISIVLYLPINLYNGYFFMEHFLPNLIGDILFDGTLYHLWYLPACILGGIIAWLLLKHFSSKSALGIAVFLYLLGLLGDSYYGLSSQVPFLNTVYKNIFEVSAYTRNGLFFAPVFLVLGGLIGQKKLQLSLKHSLLGLTVSLPLLLTEGLVLHYFDLQRHDSMYLMLLPSMVFLFIALTFWRGKRVPLLGSAALITYIIHPMVILFIRMAGKFLGLQELLIANSLIHFLAVWVASCLAAFLLLFLKKRWFPGFKHPADHTTDRSWLEIDTHCLKHNVHTLQDAMPSGCDLMAVVKANAYGHGSAIISSFLSRTGVKAFAVSTVEEGIELRSQGIPGEILILGYTNPSRAGELHKYKLTQSLIDFDYAAALNKQGKDVNVHIKIDTGMHRYGFDKDELSKIKKMFQARHLKICGIYTHLSVSDSLKKDDIQFTHQQILSFYRLLDYLKKEGIPLPKIHIQSTYGFFNYPELHCNYVRTGLALYGVLSTPSSDTLQHLSLRPVLSLKSRVVLIRQVPKGQTIGYGRETVTARDTRLALLPIGYGDGYPRNLSRGKGEVLIRGIRLPIIGRICMDQLLVDITDAPHVRLGDTATLIGRDGTEEIHAAEVAEDASTITNELISRFGSRLVRKENGCTNNSSIS